MIDAIAEPDVATASPTAGRRLAAENWRSNLRALRESQGEIADLVRSMPGDVEWVFGRDGALTAMLPGDRWWAGNSLPMRSAQFMLGKTDVSATVICFLFPTHAGQLRVVLDRMQQNQALLAIVPDEFTFRMILACENFAMAFAAHRLFLVAGDGWESQLDRLLERQIGLPTPTQFIRPILADSSATDALIAPAQKIFADHSTRRAQHVQTLCKNWKSDGLRRICVVTPNVFRLWDDAGYALLEAIGGPRNCENCPPPQPSPLSTGAREPAASAKADPTIVSCDSRSSIAFSIFNPDDPASSSPAALTALATTCDALVMPNTGRADLPDVIPDEMPLATWVTTPRIPSAGKSGPGDVLLLCEANWVAAAVEQGWKRDRVFVAGWPSASVNDDATAEGLAIISDTRPLEPPPHVTEYSSHRLLWESIAHELLDNPFALSGTADDYLAASMRRARVEDEGFDRLSFLTGVIWNAYQQGITRLLVREGLPIRLFGNGWDQIPDLASVARGPVRSREELATIVASARALVHVWPTSHAHPMAAMGKPIVAFGGRRDAFIRDARQAAAGKVIRAAAAGETLSAAVIVRALSGVS